MNDGHANHARLKGEVLVALSARGCFVWNNPTGLACPVGTTRPVRYGLPGAPDIIGILPGGKTLAVEVKTGRGRVTEDQQRWHDKARGMGALVIVVRDLAELDAYIPTKGSR